MELEYRPATPDDIAECVSLRGRTRENAVSAERLAAAGITVETWAADVRSGLLPGYVCTHQGIIAGYCFGHTASGEIVVLALLPAYENRGIGRQLLDMMVGHLGALGHKRLHLGCTADATKRSYGFYRRLGWKPTGTIDRFGDEVLELLI